MGGVLKCDGPLVRVFDVAERTIITVLRSYRAEFPPTNATSGGGGNTEGIVFKLALQVSPPWKETVLYNFQSAMDGSQPLAGVLLDNANHRLYGTTNHGRSRLGYGTIFVIQP